jgi:hypothetical protein
MKERGAWVYGNHFKDREVIPRALSLFISSVVGRTNCIADEEDCISIVRDDSRQTSGRSGSAD